MVPGSKGAGYQSNHSRLLLLWYAGALSDPKRVLRAVSGGVVAKGNRPAALKGCVGDGKDCADGAFEFMDFRVAISKSKPAGAGVSCGRQVIP